MINNPQIADSGPDLSPDLQISVPFYYSRVVMYRVRTRHAVLTTCQVLVDSQTQRRRHLCVDDGAMGTGIDDALHQLSVDAHIPHVL